MLSISENKRHTQVSSVILIDEVARVKFGERLHLRIDCLSDMTRENAEGVSFQYVEARHR